MALGRLRHFICHALIAVLLLNAVTTPAHADEASGFSQTPSMENRMKQIEFFKKAGWEDYLMFLVLTSMPFLVARTAKELLRIPKLRADRKALFDRIEAIETALENQRKSPETEAALQHATQQLVELRKSLQTKSEEIRKAMERAAGEKPGSPTHAKVLRLKTALEQLEAEVGGKQKELTQLTLELKSNNPMRFQIIESLLFWEAQRDKVNEHLNKVPSEVRASRAFGGPNQIPVSLSHFSKSWGAFGIANWLTTSEGIKFLATDSGKNWHDTHLKLRHEMEAAARETSDAFKKYNESLPSERVQPGIDFANTHHGYDIGEFFEVTPATKTSPARFVTLGSDRGAIVSRVDRLCQEGYEAYLGEKALVAKQAKFLRHYASPLAWSTATAVAGGTAGGYYLWSYLRYGETPEEVRSKQQIDLKVANQAQLDLPGQIAREANLPPEKNRLTAVYEVSSNHLASHMDSLRQIILSKTNPEIDINTLVAQMDAVTKKNEDAKGEFLRKAVELQFGEFLPEKKIVMLENAFQLLSTSNDATNDLGAKPFVSDFLKSVVGRYYGVTDPETLRYLEASPDFINVRDAVTEEIRERLQKIKRGETTKGPAIPALPGVGDAKDPVKFPPKLAPEISFFGETNLPLALQRFVDPRVEAFQTDLDLLARKIQRSEPFADSSLSRAKSAP